MFISVADMGGGAGEEELGEAEGTGFGVGEAGRQRRAVGGALTDRERVFSCHS